MSRPEIVDLIQQAIIEDTASALDSYFFDMEPATPGVRPAGALYGAAMQDSLGTSVENVLGDLRWLLGQMIAIRARKAVLVMNPLLAASPSLKTTTGTGISPFADTLAQGKLAGLPVILSDNMNATSVIAMDADSYFAAIDAPEVDLAAEATLVMSTDPENDADPQSVSLLQSDTVAIRYVQPTTCASARADVAVVLTNVNW